MRAKIIVIRSALTHTPNRREEIVNACGIDDFHDGVNYTRTSCVIAVSKARDMFEPFLHQVGTLAPCELPLVGCQRENTIWAC